MPSRNKKNSRQQENQQADGSPPDSDGERDEEREGGSVCGNDSVEMNEKGEAICVHVRKYQPNSDQGSKGKNKQPIIRSVRCLDCISAQKEDGDVKEEKEDLWLCMQCLEARCGRYSTNSHSVKHYEADNNHCLALSIANLQIWCYNCDAFIDPHLVKGKLESVTCAAKKAFGSKQIKPKAQSYTKEETRTVECKETTTKNMRVIGLNNLGNTCYFNSALQNLLYLRPFRDQLARTMTRTEYTLVPKKHPDLPVITFTYANNQAAEPGKLTKELNNLIGQTLQCEVIGASRGQKYAKKTSVTPRLVQNEIARKYRKFSNGSQQDSHELMLLLIDMVKDEEIKRLKTAFLNHFDIKDHKTKFKTYSEEKKTILRKYASEFKDVFVFKGTFIDDTFGGKLLSTVHCLGCGNIFDVTEDFLDISLPLPADSKKGKYQSGQQQTKKLSSKQAKQLNKAEKKKLKKQNSKKMDLQTFHKSTSNTDGASSPVESIELEPITTSGQRKKSSNEVNDISIGEGTEVQGEETNLEQEDKLSKEQENKLSKEQEDKLSKEQDLDCEKNETPENQITSNETTELNKPETKSENSDSLEGNNNSTEREKRSTPEPEGDSDQLPDEAMEVDGSQSDPHPLQPTESETESNENEVKVKSKEVRVKSKEVRRLKEPPIYPKGSLEYYLMRFFSPETLEKGYFCTKCNPQLASEEDKTSETDSDEEREDSQSIDLETLQFSDAVKQFHIETLPPVLAIHLKRFSQSGFRLQKVNAHVEFPLVLDMAPFCTANTPVPRDHADRILYGLRGIVSHSGGMVAGHYVAYVNIADWDVPSEMSSDDIAKCNAHEEISTDQTMATDPDQRNVDNNMDFAAEDNTHHEQLPQPTPPLTTPDIHLHDHVTPSEEWYHISDSHYSRTDHANVFSTQAYILFYERLPLV